MAVLIWLLSKRRQTPQPPAKYSPAYGNLFAELAMKSLDEFS